MVVQAINRDKITSADIDKVKGNLKAVILPEYEACQKSPSLKAFVWVDSKDRTWGFVEQTGDKVLPYFDTGLYINLETMNLISKGERNFNNMVVMPLSLFIEKRGVTVSRERVLSALERYCLGYPVSDCFLVGESQGSFVSRSLGRISDTLLTAVLLDGIYNLKSSYFNECLRSDAFDSFSYKRGNRLEVRYEAFLSLLRCSDSDYVFRSCIEFPQYFDVLLQSMKIQDLEKGLREFVLKKLYEGKYRLERDDSVSELGEDTVDLSRIFTKIKEVVK